MLMTDSQRREAAVALVEAYVIGQLVTDAKVAAGRVVKGHKIGLTSKAMRSLFDERDEPPLD